MLNLEPITSTITLTFHDHISDTWEKKYFKQDQTIYEVYSVDLNVLPLYE